MITNILEKSHRSEPLFQALRDRIVQGDYPAGQILSEKELCEEFKVSRTPFREAIRKLEELKLVKVVPRFGSYVAEVDIQEVKWAYEVRRPLEILAGRLAAQRCRPQHLEQMETLLKEARLLIKNNSEQIKSDIDRRFHQIIREAARNPILTESLDNLHLVCSRVWNSILRESFSADVVIKGLESVLKALQEKDADAMAEIMDQHMQKTLDSLKSQIV